MSPMNETQFHYFLKLQKRFIKNKQLSEINKNEPVIFINDET